jgi:glycosyltransferase involved in cell wall biosynthesis
MGYNNKLLYWDALLRNYIQSFPNTNFLTCETSAKIQGTDSEVRDTISTYKLTIFGKTHIVISPIILLDLYRLKPNLIVISEFGLISLYASVYKLLKPSTKILLLVENHPKYLKHNNKDRTGFFYTLVRQIVAHSAHVILCNNNDTKQYLISKLKVSEKNIVAKCYLTSSINVNQKSIELKSNKSKVRLLFVGRLDARKGVRQLIDAIAALPFNLLSMIVLDIVGDGEDFIFLNNQVEKLHLQIHVKFHGACPYDEIGSHFARADIFVFPTLGDYRALVGFEALSAGLPIIGSVFDGASSEILEDGINGFLVNPLIASEITEKIALLLRNPGLVDDFGIASELKFRQFSIENAVGNITEACSACFR